MSTRKFVSKTPQQVYTQTRTPLLEAVGRLNVLVAGRYPEDAPAYDTLTAALVAEMVDLTRRLNDLTMGFGLPEPR